ncbi:MAG TPA: ATP-binding protein [Alphaproteobacteria bacterium]|nr:ATP-binding protein [Alphaproteobacteria bacterium]
MFKFLKVEVVHWDFWERFSLPMGANVITIVGPNGSGKTTLLDALRTLLCIECSSGRDYKRYVRRNEKPFSWIRAVVDNERLDSGLRPFFPILSEKVTLACQIRKKGGDWQRQFMVADGDVEIENLEEKGVWTGVREYRQRLENAGLTHAIQRVLSLEQGDTDKLCEYSPRQLLELVFSVFGDQEVLDNYQQAKNEQLEIGRELEKLEEEIARLGIRLREAEANVNSYREWERLNKELQKLSLEILPRSELADLHDRITSNRGGILKKRDEMRVRLKQRDELRAEIGSLAQDIESKRTEVVDFERAERIAQESFTAHRDSARDCEKILKDKTGLEELCRQQQAGIDAAALTAEQRKERNKLAANNHELEMLRDKAIDLRSRISTLKAGKRIEPGFVQDFQRNLNQANIDHQLLTDIVEVKDPQWQKALEGVMGPFAHIVLLKDPKDRQKAWALGENLRYRHFVVAERHFPTAVLPGSLMEVVSFREAPPEWLAELLNRIRRVESVEEGCKLSGDAAWITSEGYHRERRGGRYIGVDSGSYQFGENARKNLIITAETELSAIQEREKELRIENDRLIRRIDDIQKLLTGMDAAQQIAARSAEFAQAEMEFTGLTQKAQEAANILADCLKKRKAAEQRLKDLEIGKTRLDTEFSKSETETSKDLQDLRLLRKQQGERIVDYRNRRRPMPSRWYSREALAELREKYESAEAVRRDINRQKERLDQGTWVTDSQVVAVEEKLRDDHTHLAETIKVRGIHHQRHMRATEEARESYINVLRATVRRYSRNVRSLGELAGIGVDVEPPHLVNEDLALAQAGLNVKFNFDKKGMIGLNDGEASGGQQVMKSLILLIGLLMDESRPGGFVFIDEPFAHLDVFNIDKVGAFLESTHAQYVLTTPNTHNVNVFKTSDLTLVTQKRRHPEKWAPPVAFLLREKPVVKAKGVR